MRHSPAQERTAQLRVLGLAAIRPITTRDVARHLQITPQRAASRLGDMKARGLIRPVGFAPHERRPGPALVLYGVAA